MIEIAYKSKNKTLSVNTDSDSRVLLSDKSGCFCSFSPANQSRYDGFYYFDDSKSKSRDMFKILDHIKVEGCSEFPGSIEVSKEKVVRVFNKNEERFFMPEGKKSFLYGLKKPDKIKPFFDVKEIYDNSEWGREYQVELFENYALISFKKKIEEWENGLANLKEFEMFVGVGFKGIAKRIDEWKNVEYPHDRSRNSMPFERHVYCPIELFSDKLVITAGFNKNEVIENAKSYLKRFDALEKQLKDLEEKNFKYPHLEFAYAFAKRNVEFLGVNEEYYFAGIPWFCQEWPRDEAIMLSSILELNQKKGIDIALNLIKGSVGGKLKNKLSEDIGTFSIDALPFVFKRLNDTLIFKPGKKTKFSSFGATTKKMYLEIIKKMLSTIDEIQKNHMRAGLVFSYPHETWMDSVYDIDDRLGFNIEVQAMMIYLLSSAYRITGLDKYKNAEIELRKNVIKHFWNGLYLCDNTKNKWIRPNVFLAYYFVPNLLTDEGWKLCFDYAIKELWLSWGGFASIQKNSSLFCPVNTGEDAKSYHRGDSWYFMNNIAAIALSKFDPKRYSKHISAILSASTYDILFGHALGCASEISDAKEQNSRGAFAQGFSASTYIEMVDELFKFPTEND
jgi:glycogen debranching enzyme